MTTNRPPVSGSNGYTAWQNIGGDHEEPAKRRRHVFLWLFLALQLVFVVWIAVGAHSAQQTSCTGLTAQDCANAKDVGTTIGVGLIIGLWAAVDLIVGGTYALYRLAKRR